MQLQEMLMHTLRWENEGWKGKRQVWLRVMDGHSFFYSPVTCRLPVDHGGLPAEPAEMDCQGGLDMSIQR